MNFFSEVGQIESPRYANRPVSVHSTSNSSYVNQNGCTSTPIEQLQKDFLKMKTTMDEMKSKFAEQIRDLVGELDQEKKARANLQIELERLQKQIQKSSLVN